MSPLARLKMMVEESIRLKDRFLASREKKFWPQRTCWPGCFRRRERC